MHVVASRDTGAIERIHVVRSLNVASIARVDDRSVSRDVAARRNGNRRSALGNVIISQAEGAEMTDKTAKAVMMGRWAGDATRSSNIMSSLSSHVSRSHAGARSLVVGIGNHGGVVVVVVVVRHCGFCKEELLALSEVQIVGHEGGCANASAWVDQGRQNQPFTEGNRLVQPELCCHLKYTHCGKINQHNVKSNRGNGWR